MGDNERRELIDRFAKGQLGPDESKLFNEMMDTDEQFRSDAEEHLRMVDALKLYGNREFLKRTFADIHHEPISLTEETPVVPIREETSLWRKYWPLTAVAASVAFVSILGTLLLTQSLKSEQATYYKELRRNVEQLKRSQNTIIANIEKSNEKAVIKPGRYAGTGFLVSSNGYVVTSHHVVKGADSVYIENPQYGILKTSVVLSDATNDVSILRIENLAFKAPRILPFTVSSGEANLGEDVYTLGFPREDIVFGEGSISASTGYGQNPNAYQVSVPVNPGNSGGPLFNGKGDLVGIISGIETETSGAAFAIKSSVLLNVIQNIQPDSLHAALILPKTNTLRNLSKVEQIKRWKDNVFIVRVYKN